MLIIDGVRYQEWEISNEDELEQMVIEHAQDIFGENSIYFDKKQKLKSLAGVGSIPDGLVIMFGSVPQWHIVEVELSSHDPYAHIVPQVDKFINGISNPNIQRGIVNAIYSEITRDDFLRLRLKRAVEATEIYKFLSDLISKQPILTIIIEKDTQELREALTTLRYPQIKVVEFKTFIRKGVGLAAHAHLFEPVFQAPTKLITPTELTGEVITIRKVAGRVTGKRPAVKIKDLIDTGVLKVSQVIYGWHEGNRYEGKVLNGGKILVAHTGQTFDSLSGAASHVRGYQEDGWRFWRTTREDGRECKLAELRKE